MFTIRGLGVVKQKPYPPSIFWASAVVIVKHIDPSTYEQSLQMTISPMLTGTYT